MLSVESSSRKLVFSKPKGLNYLLFLYVYSALLLLFCTPNSPLFSMQSWVDPNVYMDVGRAMSEGRVLYRDVFDHKGPLFLMAFAVLAPISRHSLLGLYLLQIACLGTSLVFLFKTSRLFVSHTASLLICIGFPFFLLSQPVYCNGGGSPEEILLPFFMGSLYFIIESFFIPKDSASKHSQLRRFWFLGLFFGITLLTKINLSVFIAAGSGMLLLQFLLKKDTKNFAGALLRFFGGILTAFLPCVIYWTATRSLRDCYDTYILFNMAYISSKTSVTPLFSAARTLAIIFTRNFGAILIVVVGLIILQLKKLLNTYLTLTLFLMFLSLLIITFGAGYAYWYYCIPFVCFAGLGEIGIAVFFREIAEKLRLHFDRHPHPVILPAAKVLLIVLFLITIILGNGFWRLSIPFSPEKSGVEAACDTILTTWKESETTCEPDILLYNSLETGFYTQLGTAPIHRYFYSPGMDTSLLPDYVNAQNSYVTEGLPDYIICISGIKDADFGIAKLNSEYCQIGVFDRLIGEPYFDSGLSYITLYQKM